MFVSGALPESSIKGRALVDLGSGDGRIVVEAAKQGMIAKGVELNTWLLRRSKKLASSLKLGDKANFLKENLWTHDVSPYHVIVVSCTEPFQMNAMVKKLKKEAQVDSWVISSEMRIPGWQPLYIEQLPEIDGKLYYYRMKEEYLEEQDDKKEDFLDSENLSERVETKIEESENGEAKQEDRDKEKKQQK